MKARQSGMPDEAYWETLFDVQRVLDDLGLDGALGDVFELGCGYGTFSIPVARRIRGVLDTVDIDPAMVRRTRERAAAAGLRNLRCRERDALAQGFGIAPGSMDACLLFNILHCEEPIRLLAEARVALRPGGLVYVIHWRCDPATPRGPDLAIRPRPEQCIEWAKDAGLQPPSRGAIGLPPYHYGLVFPARG